MVISSFSLFAGSSWCTSNSLLLLHVSKCQMTAPRAKIGSHLTKGKFLDINGMDQKRGVGIHHDLRYQSPHCRSSQRLASSMGTIEIAHKTRNLRKRRGVSAVPMAKNLPRRQEQNPALILFL